jgi:anthranilate synthase/indole-3-glycerol phosphate synthase/phosphoribosylanthranilate isomerase
LSGTNTPPGSLSTQTQLASLRGALEAARLREEKTKVEIERYSKDLEMMRWESATWRRREMEVGFSIYNMYFADHYEHSFKIRSTT